MLKHAPIIVVGMARSGTTLVTHILGSLPGVHIEAEPHALWKSGNFKYFNDEQYDITAEIVDHIRTKLTQNLGDKLLVEKSPINSLRPHLVHSVFPEAKIVYIERDPVRCIYSNYSRSLKKDSYKFSIILKKYFLYTGSKDLSGAISDRKLFDQITAADLAHFIKYNLKMLYLREVKNLLPFGPKLHRFEKFVKEKGLLQYHAEVYKKTQACKQVFKKLYGDKMKIFGMEEIMNGRDTIRGLVEFTGIPYTEGWLQDITKTFDAEKVEQAIKQKKEDAEIMLLLD